MSCHIQVLRLFYIFIYFISQYQYMSIASQSTNVTIYARVTKMEKDRIEVLVEGGAYMSLSDFVRQAVREKLGDN